MFYKCLFLSLILGGSQDDCSSETTNIPYGLFLTSVLKENPFARTELSEFVELDQAKNMACFVSTIFYNNGSSYRETSDGLLMTFRGHLKFGTLRFENLDIKLLMENQRCLSTNIRRQSGTVAELSGNFQRSTTLKKLGIFHIPTDSVVNFNIGQDSRAASRGSFLGLVNILGFKSTVTVNISQNGLEFYTKGKVHDMFDVSAIFKSRLTSWTDQRFTATGVFKGETVDGSLHRILENELTRYSTELLAKVQARVELSTKTEERAKHRLREVQHLREEWLKKFQEVKKEYDTANNQLNSAENNLYTLLELAEEFSDEIRMLKEELNKLCKVKYCPKICQKGRSCSTCWKYVIGTKMGKCSATCHNTKQERIPPLVMDAICKNEHCKRIHTVHSWLGDVLGLVVGIGGTLLGVPPQISFGIGKGVSKFTRSIKQGKPDFGAFADSVIGTLSAVGAPKEILGFGKAATSFAKGNQNPFSITGSLANSLHDELPDEIREISRDVKNIKHKVKSLVKDKFISPAKETIESFVKDEIVSPAKETIESFVKDEIVSPVKETIESFDKDEIVSPVKDKIESFPDHKILSRVKDDSLPPIKRKVRSTVEDKIGSFAEDEIISPVKDRIESFADDKILSPFKDKIGSFAEEQILSPINGELNDYVHEAKNVRSKLSSFGKGAENKLRSFVKDKIGTAVKDKIKSVVSSKAVGAAKNVLDKAAPIVGGVLSLVQKSQGHWECTFKEEKCTKESFQYKYIHTPYTCELPCEQRYVAKSLQKSCCSVVSCASFVANLTCLSENAYCKKARRNALDHILKVKAGAAKILASLDSAQQNVSFWEMKKERLSVEVRSASRSLQAYQNAASSLEEAYNVTLQNRKRKLEILAKPLMLRNFLSEHGESLVKVEDIKFKVKVSAKHNSTLLPINITVNLNETRHEEVSTILDFSNLNRSLRSITKDILGAYVGDVSRLSRKKRSIKNTNVSVDELKFNTLQTFHRLCSEFSNHKQTLVEVATSLYNLSFEIQQFYENDTQNQTSLIVNSSVIFQRVSINQTKGKELGVDINYDSYSNVLENDPELLEAIRLQDATQRKEFEAVESSSKLLYKNWLATMENIFETISEECSGFDDCLKHTIDSLAEITFDASLINAEKLRTQIGNIETKFNNLTRQSDVSVSDALHISQYILQVLENMTGVEDVCAQAPNITEHPVPFTNLGVNDSLVLKCKATGDSLVYQWRFNSEILKNQSTNILRINKTSPLHSGNYSCDVSNHVAKATSILALVVISTRPLIVHHPTPHRNFILSEYDSLHCQVTKNAPNISFQWWFKPVNSTSFTALPNETFSHLSFAPVKSHHEGWYYCNVSNLFSHTISKKSFVRVLNFTLPVPAAKLTLTVISKSCSGNKSVYYQDTLAKVLASRLPNANNSSQRVDERIRELHPTSCKIMTRHDGFYRTEICDWTFSAVGENVTSNAILNSAPSLQIKRIISATFKIKKALGKLGNETNAGTITFTLEKTNYSVQKHSLTIIAMALLCPKRQFLIENVYKCGKSFTNLI